MTTTHRDGALPTKLTYGGPVSGSVAWTYESPGLRVDTETVDDATPGGASTVDHGYDADELLVSLSVTGGPTLTLTRDPGHGMVTGTTLGTLTTTHGLDVFGERTVEEVRHGSTLLYRSEILARDGLGRVRERRETVSGVTTSFAYGYL